VKRFPGNEFFVPRSPALSANASRAITSVHLTLSANIPGADQAKFEELAGKAKAGCRVSKLLNAKITLDATLLS
jgi:organic hydroperoxide reductase OsmC/OhrA